MVTAIEIKRENREPSRVMVGNVMNMLPELLPPDRRVIMITDHNVFALYGDIIGMYEHIVIDTGEGNKTLHTVDGIYRRLIELGADRRTYIVGFGGGITTDIAGFVASTWLRGVEFGFVATSLLAQVDASVGGKNGVNIAGYKNMAGSFNQPDFVLCDTGVLTTLPPREFRAGVAEMIKAGIIANPELFGILETHSLEELLADRDLLAGTIVKAINVKAAIVEADEREKGERRKLNLGHTVAHAVEKLSGKYNHGEAVAVGLVSIADVGVRLGVLSSEMRDRICSTVARAGLPTTTDIPVSEIAEALARDKKVECDFMWLALPSAIGEVVVRRMPINEFILNLQNI
jgi:3-dehydroquinate synthase